MSTTADQYTVKSDGAKYAPAPEGQYVAVCVDFVLLGDAVDQYQNNEPRIVTKGALVFQIEDENADTGKRYEPAIEFNLTFGEKASLRKFLENWRGKPYTNEEARKGAPLHKLAGQCGVITVTHKTSIATGRSYAKITNITPLMKGLPKLEPVEYERSTHWEKKKEDNAASVRGFHEHVAPSSEERSVEAILADDETDLPF
jgi:hypothetical protein